MQRRWCHLLAARPIPSRRWRKTDSNPRVPQKGGQWFFETAPFNRAGLSWPRKLVAAAFQRDPLPPTKSPSPEGRSSRGAPAFFRPFGRHTNDREPAEKGVPYRTPRARTTSSKSGTSCHPAIRIFDEASYSQFLVPSGCRERASARVPDE